MQDLIRVSAQDAFLDPETVSYPLARLALEDVFLTYLSIYVQIILDYALYPFAKIVQLVSLIARRGDVYMVTAFPQGQVRASHATLRLPNDSNQRVCPVRQDVLRTSTNPGQ